MKKQISTNNGRAENIQTAHIDPGGPIIRQCKLTMVRRPGHRILARAGFYCFMPERSLELLLLIERFDRGVWKCVKNTFITKDKAENMEIYLECKCKSGDYYRARGFFIVNDRGDGMVQREIIYTRGIWNIWGATDGYNEMDNVPLDEFYDEVPMPDDHDQSYREKDRKPYYYFRNKFD